MNNNYNPTSALISAGHRYVRLLGYFDHATAHDSAEGIMGAAVLSPRGLDIATEILN